MTKTDISPIEDSPKLKRPTKPQLPEAPDALKTVSTIVSDYDCGYFPLKDLIPAEVNAEDVILSIGHDRYMGECDGVITALHWDIPNPNLKEEQEEYNSKLAIYAEKFKLYEENMKAWKKEDQIRRLDRNNKKLEKLEKELQKTMLKINNLKSEV